MNRTLQLWTVVGAGSRGGLIVSAVILSLGSTVHSSSTSRLGFLGSNGSGNAKSFKKSFMNG